MSSNYATRKVTQLVTTVARKVSTQQSPIITVTVLSRNPDGSLNVDDGRGGCRRVAARANVRIGEKIVLGTEPAIGQQTDLPVVSYTIEPSSVPCPDDWRGSCIPALGVTCPTVTAPFEKSADVFSFAWSSNAKVPPYPGADGIWVHRLTPALTGTEDIQEGFLYNNSGPGGQNAMAQCFRRASNEDPDPDPFFAPWADRYVYGVSRVALEFDTSTIPIDSTIESAEMKITFPGNGLTDMNADSNAHLVIVPSLEDGDPDNLDNYYAFLPVILSETPISTLINEGPYPRGIGSFDHIFPLIDPDTLGAPDLYINRLGKTRFFVMIHLDFLRTSYPYIVPPSFVDLINPNAFHTYIDQVRFGASHPVLYVKYTGSGAS